MMKSVIEKIKENFFETIEDKMFKENFYFLAYTILHFLPFGYPFFLSI